MIGPDSEQLKRGEGDFHDVVAIEFCDGQAGLFGFLRVALVPGRGTASVVAVLFAGAELVASVEQPALELAPESWDDVVAGPARLGIEQPLERWTAELDAGASGFEITLRATTAPLELLDPEVSDSAGIEEYEQLCAVQGTVRVEGRKHKIDCSGRRMHVWGAPAWDQLESRRAIYASSAGGSGVTILSSRPAGGGQDRELSSGYIVAGPDGQAPGPLEQVLLSTVYDRERMPRSAGVELYLPGEEFGHRLSGESLCEARLTSGGREHRISFFRWSLDGAPCWGSYQSVSRS
jgi:hypothetical protein